MIDLNRFINLDQIITLYLNGSDSVTFDKIMMFITETWTWIPVAICLLYIIIRNNCWKGSILTIVTLALVITFSDQITSGLCKPLFHRLRPTQDSEIMYLVDIVNGYRGGKYGFMSSHAANTFSVCVCVSLIIKNKYLTFTSFLWALLNSYSRIYLGVHFFGDVLCGAIVGICIGFIMHFFFKKMMRKIGEKNIWYSTTYTSSGYLITDINFLLFIFYLSFVSIIILSLL